MEQNKNITALQNLLGLAEQGYKYLYGNISEQTGISADQIIADESIEQVMAILTLLKAGATISTALEANIALAEADRNTLALRQMEK
jgi:type II secretory pathway component PulF